MGRRIEKDEFNSRMSIISADVNERISERPTITWFKRVLTKYDEKIENFKSELDFKISTLNKEKTDIEAEIV